MSQKRSYYWSWYGDIVRPRIVKISSLTVTCTCQLHRHDGGSRFVRGYGSDADSAYRDWEEAMRIFCCSENS